MVEIKENKIKFDKEVVNLGRMSLDVGSFQNMYLLDTLPVNIYDDFNDIYSRVLKNKDSYQDMRKMLAGEIFDEYLVNHPKSFEKYLFDLLRVYEHRSDQYIKKVAFSKKRTSADFDKYLKDESELVRWRKRKSYEIPDMKIGNTWINLQKKYEFNPIHNHSGVLSYVIWHKIPYNLDDEIDLGAGKGKKKNEVLTSKFCFFSTSGDKILSHPINVDKSFEGTICVFPSFLNHAVYPFYTSDDYRVSFSSNIYLK